MLQSALMKLRIIGICLFFMGFLTCNQVWASGELLLVNQIRGTECCDNGSLDALKAQIQTIKDHDWPAIFLWRYDALTDPNFLRLWQETASAKMTAGIWLEVTPRLAQEAKVEYRGHTDNWYQAQHSLLIGYTQDERQKLIAEVYRAYQQAFGGMPTVGGAWGIDSTSLNSLHDQGMLIWVSVREHASTDMADQRIILILLAKIGTLLPLLIPNRC